MNVATTAHGFERAAHGCDRCRPGAGVLDVQDDMIADVDYAEPNRCLHWALLRQLLRDEPPNPYDHPRSPVGLTTYLQACGVAHFSGPELAKMRADAQHAGDIAERLPVDPLTSRPVLLPARWVWPRAACVLSLAERLRERAGPLAVLHWWRPAQLNAAVGGAAGSDHLTAAAIDFRAARGGTALGDGVRDVIDPVWRAERIAPLWGLSFGYRPGSDRIHLGSWAPRTAETGAARRWSYAPDGSVLPWAPY